MTIEKTGKNISEAIEEALAELQATEADVEIEILEEAHKGFLNLGSKLAKVRVTLKHDPVRIAKIFLKEMSEAMGIELKIETELKEKELNINLSGENMGVLIGKRGQTLDSLQYVVNLAVNKGEAPYLNVTIDTENYRKRRRETLEALARNLAKKVKTTKESVTLEPMSPNERRIIHSTLQNDRYVATHSEGEDPHRNVVISLKDKDYVPRSNNRPSTPSAPPVYNERKPFARNRSLLDD